MRLTSSAFEHKESIPPLYTCQGKEINPPLEFHNVPEGAKSLVLILDDPDVPEWVRPERIWDHWILFNLDPALKGIEENSPPIGIAGKNTGGEDAYQGPCPPDREHRYFFKLYALDCLLSLPPGCTKSEVEKAMENHVLAKAELIGLFEKT